MTLPALTTRRLQLIPATADDVDVLWNVWQLPDVRRYLFDDLALHRVTIQCGTGNQRSCAIPQRLGFTREGVMREAEWVNDRWVDLVVWGMLSPDWHTSE